MPNQGTKTRKRKSVYGKPGRPTNEERERVQAKLPPKADEGDAADNEARPTKRTKRDEPEAVPEIKIVAEPESVKLFRQLHEAKAEIKQLKVQQAAAAEQLSTLEAKFSDEYEKPFAEATYDYLRTFKDIDVRDGAMAMRDIYDQVAVWFRAKLDIEAARKRMKLTQDKINKLEGESDGDVNEDDSPFMRQPKPEPKTPATPADNTSAAAGGAGTE